MARRIYISNSGLRVSQATFDAKTAPEGNLIFSTTTLFFQRLAVGSFTVTQTEQQITYPGGVLIEVPVVYCIIAGDGGTASGMEVYGINSTYFWARPVPTFPGSYPAVGKLCTWVAFRNPGI